MAASSQRLQRIVELVEELDSGERAELELLLLLSDVADAVGRAPAHVGTAEPRHEFIAERVARVHAGDVATLSLDAVERGIRAELDF